jgi:hypothetical protein
VRRMVIRLAVVLIILSGASIKAQNTAPATIQAASYSQAYCSGFIAETRVPRDLTVQGGSDDDFHSVVRQFVKGESVFIAKHNGADIAVGTEYSVVRPATDLFQTTRYQGENWDIRKLGTPYADVAQVRVTHSTPKGIVANITFSCEAIMPGDILVPFQTRAIPEYTLTPPLDHFAPLEEGKARGRIAATADNFGYLGRGTIVYLSLGNEQSVQPGNRFRIYNVPAHNENGTLSNATTPPETIGEAVVLSVRPKSSVAIVIGSYREIAAGDYVEGE